jgi:NADPH:quinone reductase-like Zn-dependent oxidoreductase
VQVAADGSNFATGDAVYGLIDFWRNGDFAEFVTVAANDLAPKPQNVDHEHAAAAAMSALAAWQALFDYAALAEGHRILIHGAAGGVGSFAVQFAHWCGAHVLATAATKHREFVLDLGAHEVIDYTAQRFEDVVHDVDVVLDLIGGDTLTRSRGVLQPGGILITLAGTIDLSEASRRRVRGVRFTVKPSRTDLAAIARLIDAGTIRSIVSDVFPLACAQKAFRQGLMGHNRGKIVLRVEGGHSGRG